MPVAKTSVTQARNKEKDGQIEILLQLAEVIRTSTSAFAMQMQTCTAHACANDMQIG